jgi:hypothetical protein
VRRTRLQIRQQTEPVGFLYPSLGTAFSGNSQRSGALNLSSTLAVPEEGDMVHVASEGDTVERVSTSIMPCLSAAVATLDAHPAFEMDSIDDSSSNSEQQSESVESGEDSYEFRANADSSAGICIDDPVAVAVELQKNAFNTALSDSARTDLLLRWQSIYALLLTRGTVRFTEDQYEDARVMLDWASKHGNIPSPSTMRRTIVPAIRDYSYAHSVVCSLRTKSNEYAADSSLAARNYAREGRVRLVFPSNWALLDCRTGPVFESIAGERTGIQVAPGFKLFFSDIEDTPIVRNRTRFLDTSSQIFVNPACTSGSPQRSRLPVPAKSGDSVSIILVHSEDSLAILGCGKPGCLISDSDESLELIATIRGVWLIEDGRPITDPDNAQGEVSFSFCSMLKNGDTVAELIPDWTAPCCEGPNSLYLLVYRFCRTSPGEATKQLVVAQRCMTEHKELVPARSKKARVASVHLHKALDHEEITSYAPSTGFLQDGRKYFVYRAMLYTDDFQAHVSRNGSYGGCYMLPIGILPEERAGYSAVRCISLTPPDVSTNEVLLRIIPDIVKCTTTGIEGKDANGERVTIFLDIVGYIGDYPAVTHALDVLGHNSRAPCHLCAFLRQDRTGTEGLNYYGYSTAVHSRASSFCRDGRRINSVRSGLSSSSLFQALGLRHPVDESQCPLHVLCGALSKVRSQVPRTDCGVPVVPSVFDPYRSCMVAPDHLLFGLAQDVINATITLCSPRVRATAEGLMRDALCLQNLGRQKQLFRKTSLSLHSMTMSDVFAVLLVAPSSFHTALVLHDEDTSVCNPEMLTRYYCDKTKRTGGTAASIKRARMKRSRSEASHARPSQKVVRAIDLVQLLSLFQKLVSRTGYLPKIDVDGFAQVRKFNERRGMERLDTLFQLSCQYVTDLHSICTQSTDGVGRILNKPNVHRLLELYTHTLPAFGHVGHFQELLFETAHQPLKRGIKRSNNRDPHLSAVQAVLANDWETRLALEIASVGKLDQWSDATCNRLQQLLTGVECIGSADTSRLKSVFCPPVMHKLKSVRKRLLSLPTSHVEWRLEYGQHSRRSSFEGTWRARSATNQDSVAQALQCANNRSRGAGNGGFQARLATWASSWGVQHVQAKTSCQSTTSTEHMRKETIQSGSVVQSLVSAGHLCTIAGCPVRLLSFPVDEDDFRDSTFAVSYWLVLEVFEPATGICSSISDMPLSADVEILPHAVVLPCVKEVTTDREEKRFRADIESPASILPLSRSTRAVLCIPDCNSERCKVSNETGRLQHSCHLSRGCSFYGLGREDGYPPRVA